MKLINKYIPITEWLPKYKASYLKYDIPAGLTIGIMLIPQGIAYALIAGIDPIYGLYTALIPQLIYAFFGTSRQLAVGPVAMDSLIVFAGVSAIAQSDPELHLLMAILLAFMMGCIQLLFGIFRLGFMVNFLSKPVISGFTSAAAIIIAFNQLKHLFGIDIVRSNKIQEIINSFYHLMGDINYYSFGLGLFSIFFIVFVRQKKPTFPVALFVVIISTSLVYFLNLEYTGVEIVKKIPQGLPSFKIPSISYDNVQDLSSLALTLAFIAFLEAISSAKAIEAKKRDHIVRPNQELIALGASNIIGSFFQTYPSTGSFSRSAINYTAGAKTQMSSITAAIIVALTLLFLTPLFYFLPKCVLAAIIIGAVITLIDIKYPIQLIKFNKDDFLMLILTFSITLTIGIKEGIISGVLISIIMLIYRSTRPHIAECVQIKGTEYFRNKNRFENTEQRDDTLIFRFDGQLFFANSEYFKEQLNNMIIHKGKNLKYIILNSEGINHIDSSAIYMLENTIEALKNKGYVFIITGTIGPVRDIIIKSTLIDTIGKEMMFTQVKKAVYYIDNISDAIDDNNIALQSNN